MSSPTEAAQMFAALAIATLATRALSPRRVLRNTSRVCDLLMTSPAVGSRETLAREAHTLATSLSSMTPLSNCLDEAIAARLWLARRGVRGDVVVGMRRAANDGWDGHAWLVVDDEPYGLGDLHHTVVFRESELSP